MSSGSPDPRNPPSGLFSFEPDQIGDYRIVREVGRGGMGIVYEAKQISLGRRVALKVLPRHLVGDQKVLERFRREARAAARLHHTNLVPVFEVGQEGEVAFYAMQFIEGQGLDRLIEELRRLRGLDPHDTESAGAGEGARSVGSAGAPGASAGELQDTQRKPSLEAVAESLLSGRVGAKDWMTRPSEPPADPEAPITERLASSSITPTELFPTDSLLVRRNPADDALNGAVLPGPSQVLEADPLGPRLPFFRSVAQIGRQAAQGLAYAHARGVLHRDIKPSNLLLDIAGVVWITDFGLAKFEDDGLTAAGDIIGTVRYMAPERFDGEGDHRADVYALGLTLYEVLTLRPAFPATDRMRLIEWIKTEEPPRPRSLDNHIPRDLETIVLKAIDKDPGRRYQSAAKMEEDLARFLADEPIHARRVSVAERYWRWAKRNPAIAILGGLLTGLLVLLTFFSLRAADQFRRQAESLRTLAAARERERIAADRSRAEEARARIKADQANARLLTAQDELHRTVYATRSRLALDAWATNDLAEFQVLLELARPHPEEPDLRGWEWRFLWQLGHECRYLVRDSKSEKITHLAFSPDGNILASVDNKGLIQLRNRHTGAPLITTGAPGGGRDASLHSGVVAIAFSPDGRTLAGPGPGGSLVLYAVDTGKPVLRMWDFRGAVLGLAWSPDGKTLVAAVSAHTMRIFDARDGRLIHRSFGHHDGPVTSVAFSPDGRTLASASVDRTVKLWNLDDPVHARLTLKDHTDEVRAVAFSPNGETLASAGFDRTIRIWDARSGAVRAVIRGHASSVMALAFSPDGTSVVTGSMDHTVRLWDVGSGQELRTFKNPDAVSALAVSRDGRDIAAASDESIRVWDASLPPNPRVLRSPSVQAFGESVESLDFSPDGSRLVSGHTDFALRVWDLGSQRDPIVLRGHRGDVPRVAFSPDGRLIASASRDGTIRIWDAESGQTEFTFAGHSDEVRTLVFSSDGQTIFSSGSDPKILAWDPATGEVRYQLARHTDAVNDLTISPDGRMLGSASSDKTCVIWDLGGRQPRLTLKGHTGRVNSIAFSADGKMIATASNDDTVRVWDRESGSVLRSLTGHTDAVLYVTFSPDGRLVSAGRDQTLRIWDPSRGLELLVLRGHTAGIHCVRFSPDGRTIASASHDRTIRLWTASPASTVSPTPGRLAIGRASATP